MTKQGTLPGTPEEASTLPGAQGSPPRPRRERDPELTAMSRCDQILSDLPEESRGRVLSWLHAKYSSQIARIMKDMVQAQMGKLANAPVPESCKHPGYGEAPRVTAPPTREQG